VRAIIHLSTCLSLPGPGDREGRCKGEAVPSDERTADASNVALAEKIDAPPLAPRGTDRRFLLVLLQALSAWGV
jgi:hypothetical protein